MLNFEFFTPRFAWNAPIALRHPLYKQRGSLRTGVNHPEDDGGLLHLLIGALDADALDNVGGLAYAGGVDEAEGDAAEVDGVFDDIARGAVDVAYDGSLFAYEGVEEGGFTHIGLADDGYGHAVLDGIAHIERMGQAGDDALNLVGYLREFATVGKLELFVVAEVELKLHERGEVEELVAQGGKFFTEASA